MAGAGGWGQFQKLQDRFSGLIQAKWSSNGSNSKTRNVADSKRDLLFVWNAKECSILVANVALLANAFEGGKTHQVLELTSIPDFTVDRLLVNDTCTYLALVGARMASIVNLPGRWGSSGLFVAGEDSVLCKSYAVSTSFFIRSQSLEIRDFKWCPSPLPDQLFLILASNNTLRLYRATSPETVLQKWRVGRSPMNPPNVSMLTCLGETAVSFDFLPQMPLSSLDSGSSEDKSDTLVFPGTSTPIPQRSPPDGNEEQGDETLVWPIAVLFGKGDVFIVVPPNFNPATASGLPAKLFGPLRMFPSTPDNYGAESCSLLCLPCQPPVLVIASSSGGVIYHSVLLQKHQDACDVSADDEIQSSCFEPGGEDLGVSECQKALYVLEKVALELGLLTPEQASEELEDSLFHCRIQLYKDPISTSRYFCCHEAGVNIISVPLVSEILRLAANKTSMETVLDYMPTNALASMEQYLLCTQASNQSNCLRIQGMTVLSSQSLALCILPNGRCALLPLPLAFLQPDSPVVESGVDSTGQKQTAGNAFVDQIKRTLSHSSTQPLVMLPPGLSPSDKELLEILKRSTQTLRTEYLAKHVIAREEFKRKVTILKNTVEVRKRQIHQSQNHIEELDSSMEDIKSSLESRIEVMNNFLKRLQHVQTQLSLAEPETSVSEQKLKDFIEESSSKVQGYQTTIKSLNSRVNEIDRKREDSKQKERKESIYLSEEQGKTIKAALAENTRELARMKSRMEGILKAVNSSVC
ncbi:nuclear pore complex protein Nup88 [Neocloeon triangulifer]|uniref:nuclear pore complex protein Nup88 n=1 Tax=Neocloeon triangulifer TaxID=2078957 RepID=UPI00286EC3E3|nr:nuclear pore complex protein Nup88 [Neocloeon triangulifer]